ncbi:MAG: helix-turn-helix transcriptional regulator [Christensenellales bacterium]
MAFALSEHIRSLRKARGLTQEQLAEALGVTVGAVYKWESRLSLPELPMLVQLADFLIRRWMRSSATPSRIIGATRRLRG